MSLVTAHGGTLVDRIVDPARADALRAETLPVITLDARELADLELIAIGAASPITGFLGRADYDRVVAELRLASGVVWPLPLTLAVTADVHAQLAVGGRAALHDDRGRRWGVIAIDDLYARDPRAEARAVYGTDDDKHPGVAYLLARPTDLVGGTVEVLPLPDDLPFARHRLTPVQLRAELERRGWERVAGFQTRNPIHRAHEHLTKIAIEVSDGLVIHPLVGETKQDDVPAAVRFAAYEALIERYYPADRVILAAFPAAMRYAGPREALFHALVRKNYGINQLIVGRDHAGVGNYYPPLAAQQIFETFPRRDLGVAPLKLQPTFYCRSCAGLASSATCPHDASARLELSGTRVRQILAEGGDLPIELTRPEVAEILRAHYRAAAGVTATAAVATPTVPRTATARRGFILWFTGLSGAGKSTLAEAVRARLAGARSLEILDGDEVRTHLSKGLGFSRVDRDTNIHRIGYVARTLARNGVAVATAAISPYAATRAEVRALAEAQGITFVEVFARAELDALVARDVKGLYQKALAGEIKNFTGVDDPYEAPERPDVLVRTDRESVAESAATIVAFLRSRALVDDVVDVAAVPPAPARAAVGAQA